MVRRHARSTARRTAQETERCQRKKYRRFVTLHSPKRRSTQLGDGCAPSVESCIAACHVAGGGIRARFAEKKDAIYSVIKVVAPSIRETHSDQRLQKERGRDQ